MTSINNDLKKILRDKFNIHNITTSRLKAGFTDTNNYYIHLNELYNKEKEIEPEQLKQKEKLENELKEKIDKLKQKNKLKKLKYKLNRKKKFNYEQNNISENDDDNTTLNDHVINSVNDLVDGKINVQCNDLNDDTNNNSTDNTNNNENDDINNDFQYSDTLNTDDKHNDSLDDQYNDLNDESSNVINNDKYIESYDNNKTVELRNDLYIYFSNELIKNNNDVYLLYLIGLLKNFYKTNSNYRNFIYTNNYIKLEVVKDIHSYDNHFNGLFYNTKKQKSCTIHFYVKNDTIRTMSLLHLFNYYLFLLPIIIFCWSIPSLFNILSCLCSLFAIILSFSFILL